MMYEPFNEKARRDEEFIGHLLGALFAGLVVLCVLKFLGVL